MNAHVEGFSDHIHASTFVITHDYKVQNDYKIGELLGRGSFGEARIGTHILTDTIRAIKFLPKANISEWELDDILKEISCMRKLDHPNIAKLYEVYNGPK